MTQPAGEDTPTRQDFAEWLLANDRGRTVIAASEHLADVVKAVLETGKAGTMTIAVKIAVNDVDDRRLVTTAVVSSKPPLTDPKATIWYADADLHLTREDPKQDPLWGAPRQTADQYRQPEDIFRPRGGDDE